MSALAKADVLATEDCRSRKFLRRYGRANSSCRAGLRARTRPRQNAWISWITDRAVHDKAIPDKQHGDGPQRSGDQARTLIHAIPADGLTDVSRDKGTGDPEGCREQNPDRLVRPRGKESGDETCNEADDDDP